MNIYKGHPGGSSIQTRGKGEAVTTAEFPAEEETWTKANRTFGTRTEKVR
jgi:hypothetical protein